MKSQIAQTRKMMTPGQMKDLISAIVQGIPVNLPQGSKKELLAELKKVYAAIIAKPYSDAVLSWELFYQREYNFSTLFIPACPGENWRLLIIVDILLETLYAECAKNFSCQRWTDDDLDKIVFKNERDARNGAYAIWVKNEDETEEELRGLSARGIMEKRITTETLTERLIHELKFFHETGAHLDNGKRTLCTGSCYIAGDVPTVGWNGDKLIIAWTNIFQTGSRLYARRVIL